MDFPLRLVRSLLQAFKQRLRRWTKPDNRALALNVALDLARSRSELMIENALLSILPERKAGYTLLGHIRPRLVTAPSAPGPQ